MAAFISTGTWLGVFACIIQSALFAGLNLAVFSLSLLRLQVEADGGNQDAVKVLELRHNANQILATVIWGNVTTNVLLTLLSDSVLHGVAAFRPGPFSVTRLTVAPVRMASCSARRTIRTPALGLALSRTPMRNPLKVGGDADLV